MDCSLPGSFVHGIQEYWSKLPLPSLGGLTHLGIEPGSASLQADSLLSEPPEKQQVALVVENICVNGGDVRGMGSISGLRRSPGGGHSNPLQYSCLENPKDRGAWRATVRGVAKSQTQMSDFHSLTHTYINVINLKHRKHTFKITF